MRERVLSVLVLVAAWAPVAAAEGDSKVTAMPVPAVIRNSRRVLWFVLDMILPPDVPFLGATSRSRGTRARHACSRSRERSTVVWTTS